MRTPAVADDAPPMVLFAPKEFIDVGDGVHVEGTLSGDESRNAHVVIDCYQPIERCDVLNITAHGMHVDAIRAPIPFIVRTWAEDRIVADVAAPCGAFGVWILDRTRRTAELTEHPCKATGAKTYHYTVEDPPWWKKLKEGHQ